jgi:signal transduction histidine kinase/CheY-like chemotaxis protein
MNDSEPKRLNIVVADDEEIYLSLVRDALEDEGYRVMTAPSAFDALKIIESEEVHLIITDIRMPQMDGIELVRRGREINPHLMAIFMTGYANLNSAKNAIKQGAFDYISKPFELNEIRQAARKAAEKATEQAAGSASEKQLDRLSDFSQMLIQVGDRKSLAISSLKFVMMHYGAACGAIVIWDKSRTDFRMITLRDDTTEEISLPTDKITSCIAGIPAAKMAETFVVGLAPEGGPAQGEGFSLCINPSWLGPGQQMITIPVRRADALYGFLMIGPFADTGAVTGINLKFLSITSGQLAVSLENISLLEETQAAYAKLKQLQDETIQLEKMATRGEMSAEIGHELNNFLGVVAGNLSLLDFQLNKQNYTDLGRYVHAITENIDKIKKFTHNLMDLTPISSAREIICFDKLIAEVVDYLRPQKRFDGVRIDLRPVKSGILFEGDVVHIQQVLLNLFNNAADATAGRDQRAIDISVDVDDTAGTFCFTIKDTGVGFRPDLLEKAFHEGFTTKPHGHGFGLVVCKRIIDAHSGKLKVDSTPNVGTSITIEFPMAAPTREAAVPA